MRHDLAAAIFAAVALVGVPAFADEAPPAETRTFGVGTGAGYGGVVVTATGGGTSASVNGAAASYAPLELQFFNAKGGSFDLSIPVGAMVYDAANGEALIGATFFYSPAYSTGNVRGVLSPGVGWAYVSQGSESAQITDIGLRAGVELLGADQHVGVRFICAPALALGSAWGSSGAAAGLFGVSLSAGVIVSFYGTRTLAPRREPESPPAHPAGEEVADSAPARREDLAVCGRAYDHISALADAWTAWHPDREPLGGLPSRQAFLAMCGDLPDEAQLCLAVPYAETHRAECVPVLAALPRQETLRLDGLFFRSLSPASASGATAPASGGPEPRVDLSVCARVFDQIADVANGWVESHPDRAPRATLPSRDAFFRVCGQLPDDAQLCLNPAFEAGHRDQCAGTLGGLPARGRALLDGLFLTAGAGDVRASEGEP